MKRVQEILYALGLYRPAPEKACKLFGHMAYHGKLEDFSFLREWKMFQENLRCQRCGQVFSFSPEDS